MLLAIIIALCAIFLVWWPLFNETRRYLRRRQYARPAVAVGQVWRYNGAGCPKFKVIKSAQSAVDGRLLGWVLISDYGVTRNESLDLYDYYYDLRDNL